MSTTNSLPLPGGRLGWGSAAMGVTPIDPHPNLPPFRGQGQTGELRSQQQDAHPSLPPFKGKGQTGELHSQPILMARGIHAWYGSSHVLHGIDLVIGRGETVGLLGRNGMGKSTLIRTLLGHVTQRDGRIHLFGQDLSKGKPHEVARRGVAYVPEGRGVFPNLSVRENLIMSAKPPRDAKSGWSYERVMQTFPRLGERVNNLGNQLSGGEQQMLSIGRALMTQPELIILDEATEGLAPLIVADIWRVIAEIRASGIATLIVDRDYRKVLAQSDRALVLQKGQVVLAGESTQLRQSEQLASFLGV
jgi:branched-chain amino acid transport system ATP-binding protein